MTNYEAELREGVFPSGAWEQGTELSCASLRQVAQNRDLAGVVDVVLDDAVQQHVKGIRFPRRFVPQAVVGQPGNCRLQVGLSLSQLLERRLPIGGTDRSGLRP